MEELVGVIKLLKESNKTASFVPVCLSCKNSEGNPGISLRRGDAFYIEIQAAENIGREHQSLKAGHVVVIATPSGDIQGLF